MNEAASKHLAAPVCVVALPIEDQGTLNYRRWLRPVLSRVIGHTQGDARHYWVLRGHADFNASALLPRSETKRFACTCEAARWIREDLEALS